MVSRRLLRIKILQILYAYFKSDDAASGKMEKDLFFSIQKTHELYISIFALLNEIVRYAAHRIDLGRNKLSPAPEDINPNTRFIDNPVLRKLSENPSLKTYINEYKINWSVYPELTRNLYRQIISSDFYEEYMNKDETTVKEDLKFVNSILYRVVLNCDMLDSLLEERSIFWNNELDFVVRQVERTLKKIMEDTMNETKLLALYKDEDDRDFAKRLFRHVIANNKEYREIIERYTSNWDVDRIAYMDILLMQQAISEIIEFENIPTRVSFNEYIEISKFFSTKKSSNFINGVLDKIIKMLKDENRILKSGRGLIGES